MAKATKRFCVLAIELRSQKMGYAVFEGTRVLLDWGVRSYPSTAFLVLDRQLTTLFELFHPTVIILSRVSKGDHRNVALIKALIEIVRKQAQSVSIPARMMDKILVKEYFARTGRWNKHDIARAVVTRFPELSWRLPKKRKAWQSEPASQVVFDAAALALLYFGTTERPQIPSERLFGRLPSDE